MKAKIGILVAVLIFSVFSIWAEWERTDVCLLPKGCTINGLGPCAICTSGDKVFVANEDSDSISIIDLANNNRFVNVEVGRSPRAICISGDKVFVANIYGNSVSIVDLAKGNQVTNVAVGRRPYAICTSGDKVFVANFGSASVSIIDLRDDNRVTTVAVGDGPRAICTMGDKVFVANWWSDNVSVIDLARGNQVTNVAVGRRPCAIDISGGRVFTANRMSGSVSILSDTSRNQGFALSPLEREISYPNPFNPECYIPVNVKSKRQNVKCRIYNILGQLIREIDSRLRGNDISQISKSIYWDGRDSRGLEVPSGVYFYEVAGEGVRKMIVLR